MENRIKEVRLKRHLIQEIVANEIGVTQQALSKYEHDISIIKVDVLIRIAKYFNVTTDYLLGLSEVKRDLQGQMRVNEVLNECYELVEAYKCMDQFANYAQTECQFRYCGTAIPFLTVRSTAR